MLGDGAEQHAAGLAFLGHEVHFLFHLAEVRHDLHEAPLGADGAGDGQHLLMGGERAGDRAAVRQRVARMAVHRETECAFLHRLRGERGDLFDFLRRRLLFDGALAHHVEARGAVANQAADVDHRAEAFDGIEVAAVGLPVPRQAGQDGVPRDVLHGLHHAGEELAVLLAARRKGNAAVAEQGGGDAVPGDRGHVRIPADLGVEVGYASR